MNDPEARRGAEFASEPALRGLFTSTRRLVQNYGAQLPRRAPVEGVYNEVPITGGDQESYLEILRMMAEGVAPQAAAGLQLQGRIDVHYYWPHYMRVRPEYRLDYVPAACTFVIHEPSDSAFEARIFDVELGESGIASGVVNSLPRDSAGAPPNLEQEVRNRQFESSMGVDRVLQQDCQNLQAIVDALATVGGR